MTVLENSHVRLILRKTEYYQNIHDLHEAGYSIRQISRILNCSRNTVSKYLNGKPEALCAPTFRSNIDRYRDFILHALAEGMCRGHICRKLQQMGLICSRTAIYNYMNRLIEIHGIEISVMKDTHSSCTKRTAETDSKI